MYNFSQFDNDEYKSKIIEAEHIFQKIYKECNYQFNMGCGSYLFDGIEYKYQIETYPKQKLLYDVAKEVSSVLEIGVYMGHSLLIMLLANPNLKITCIDIDDKFSDPAVRLLQENFKSADINFIHSDSLKVLPNLKDKFDLFHIDGFHDHNTIAQEFTYCKNLAKSKTIKVILDDVDCCKLLEKHILENYCVIEHTTPHCWWANSFFKISL
jgi:spermidine synthase